MQQSLNEIEKCGRKLTKIIEETVPHMRDENCKENCIYCNGFNYCINLAVRELEE